MKEKIYISLALALILFNACKKEFEGDRNSTPFPETYAIVDSVIRDSASFLTTTVSAHWYGESKIGYITGYEVSIDNQQSWQYTKEQKGTFILSLPIGQKEGFLPIFVRAIDNQGRKDETPAQMVFPVRNTAPRIVVDAVANKRPFSTFPVIRAVWNVIDIDGFLDIEKYELVLNDTTLGLLNLPANFSVQPINDSTAIVSIRIEAERSGNTFTNNCKVYTGTRTTPVDGVLNGIQYNQVNKLFIRAVDRTGNTSAWRTDSFFIKLPVSDILLVNAMRSSASQTVNFFRVQLGSVLVGITQFDTLYGVATQFRNDEFYTDALTQSRTFALFKKIIWLTDDPNTLENCQQNTVDFFLNNGKMFIYSEFGNDFPTTSQTIAFTPIEYLLSDSAGGNFRIDNNAQAVGFSPGWPVLRTSQLVNRSVRPFKTYTISSGVFRYDTLMNAAITIQRSSGSVLWQGINNVMSKRIRINDNKSDLILTTLPLQNMNANNNADSLFKKIFIDELEF
jgi:hypothetical protein